MNTVTNRVVRLLGKDEALRFMNLSLYQGAPAKKAITTVVRVSFRILNQMLVAHSFYRPWRLPLIQS